MLLRAITITLFSFFILSCSDNDSNGPIAEEIIGAYSGKFIYRPLSASEPTTTENHTAIVARNADFNDMFECSIATLSQIVVFDGVTISNSGKISGDVKLYSVRDEIGQEGKEIAGAGTFSYENDQVTILWTADPINGRWFIEYESN